jgi:hypothetical protein
MWQSFLNWFRQFSREQQVLVIVISVCGLLAFGLSFYRLRLNVTAPFLVDKREIGNAKDIIGPTPAEEEAKQKRMDTDGDALSDWDEVHVFQTNPNLRDTCGDGVADNVRLATGQNIDCLAGSPGVLTGTQKTTSTTLMPSATLLPNAIAPTAGISAGGAGSADATSLPRDSAAIRAALQGKVEQAKLDALSDEELLRLYDEATAQPVSGYSSSTVQL